MIEIKGKKQPTYLVRDTKTGAVAITNESYAKKLQREGKKQIIAKEGEKAYEEGKVK